MNKVLILTVTAGYGHNAAAESMKEKLESQGCAVKIVDVFKDLAKKEPFGYGKSYAFIVNHFRHIYSLVWRFLYMQNFKACGKNCGVQGGIKNLHDKLLRLIYNFQPDVIYCTNFTPAGMLCNLRRVYKLPSVNIACTLDYVVTPFYEVGVNGVDILTVAHQDMMPRLLKKGYNTKQLVCTGIPINEKFSQELDKKLARKKLGLKQDLFTVLVFFGGGYLKGGFKSFKALAKNIKSQMQIVVINGKDQNSKEKIDKMLPNLPKNLHIKNVGFTSDVPTFLSAADVMIGKCGGLSTTETINKNLPLIVTEKLNIQERHNFNFLKNKKLCLSFKHYHSLPKIVEYLMQNPQVLQDIKNGLKPLAIKATNTISELIVSQPKADYSGIDANIDFGKVNKLVAKARKKA